MDGNNVVTLMNGILAQLDEYLNEVPGVEQSIDGFYDWTMKQRKNNDN